MKTTICGIPCLIEVTHYSAGTQGKTNADPDSCYESDPTEIEFDVLDRKGRPAPWLARKLTDAETARIEAELLALAKQGEPA